MWIPWRKPDHCFIAATPDEFKKDEPVKSIVITTINSPTEAIEQLSRRTDGWPLIVIGDNKTPSNWAREGARFVSIADQRELDFQLAKLLPENHYCRKNLGYLLAMAQGVDRLAETDDDNLPAGWPLEDATRTVRGHLAKADGWLNIYEYFTDELIWPRGYPLNKILPHSPVAVPTDPRQEWQSSVQQYLAAGDPDVDAVYRLTVGKDDHVFRDTTVGLDFGTVVPFNSQSTLWFSEAFPYLYLPSFVSFRMTDIWRSFVAQICLWAVGDRVTYHGKGVKQVRNEHDLMRDYRDEVVGYDRNEEIVENLQRLQLSSNIVDGPANLLACYRELKRIGIVPDKEIPLVEAWIADVAKLTLKG